jgi:hypothetical protein
MSEMIERVARAIAEASGDRFEDVPLAKWHWTEKRGEFGGRFRDVNEPYQSDYIYKARAAIEAMREPTPAMLALVNDDDICFYQELHDLADESTVKEIWQTLIDASLKETTDV